MWEKYYPFLNNKVDEEFDGTFPVVTYENANMIFNGYLKTNTCYYRLKWKRQTYSASFYYPTYANSSTIISNNHLGYTFESENIADLAKTINVALMQHFEYDECAKKYQSTLSVDSFISSHKVLYDNLIK